MPLFFLESLHISSSRLRSNKIKALPDLSECHLLQQLDLGINLIDQLQEKPFVNQHLLADLLLDRWDFAFSFLSHDINLNNLL